MNDKIKILILEDDQSLLDLYDLALPDTIFEKKLAENGASAMENYLSWRPDILLLDLLLPDMSGHTVLKEIREDHGDKNTAIIVSTSSDFKTDMDTCKRLGIEGYLVKPFKPMKIAGQILEYYKAKDNDRADEALKLLENR